MPPFRTFLVLILLLASFSVSPPRFSHISDGGTLDVTAWNLQENCTGMEVQPYGTSGLSFSQDSTDCFWAGEYGWMANSTVTIYGTGTVWYMKYRETGLLNINPWRTIWGWWTVGGQGNPSGTAYPIPSQ